MPPKEDKEKSGVADELFFMAMLEQANASIDWDKVAKRCDIVSKGAAAKRWSRLKTKYETEHNFKFAGFAGGKKGETKAAAATGEGEDGSESPKKTPAKKTPAQKTPAEKTPAQKTPAKKSPNKKRKVEEAVKEDEEEAEEVGEQEPVKKDDEEAME